MNYDVYLINGLTMDIQEVNVVAARVELVAYQEVCRSEDFCMKKGELKKTSKLNKKISQCGTTELKRSRIRLCQILGSS